MEPTHYLDIAWRLACASDPADSRRSVVVSTPEAPSVLRASLLRPPSRYEGFRIFAPPAGLVAPGNAVCGVEEAVADLLRMPLDELIEVHREMAED